MISMDTVRADALGAYGGPAETPVIDAFAEASVLFENHVSAAPSTLASHTSLMTGQYPHTHGVPRNAHRLDDANLMLAEILQGAGFETAAILGAMPLGEHSNFGQGFDVVDADFRRPRESKVYEQAERSGDLVTDAALAWVDGAGAERLFLFVHYFDAHQPYEATEDRTTGSMRSIYRLRRRVSAGESAETGAISEALKPLYWAEISYVDAQIGRLLEGLQGAGVLEDALVILTSDHGESYVEHGEVWDHGTHVYDQTIHTPLIISLPGVESGRRDAVVSNVDVMPTVLEVLGLPGPSMDGRSLGALLRGESLAPRPVFAEATKPWDPGEVWHNESRRKSVRLGNHKMVWMPKTGAREFYDLAADPGEQEVLDNPDLSAQLIEVMAEWTSEANPKPSQKVVAPDITEHLKALGYVD